MTEGGRHRRHPERLSRRRLLRAGALATPALWLAGCARGLAEPVARPKGTLFTLGVASGDPHPDGVVLWTRLAPDPAAGGGMPPRPVEVAWEVAEDEGFRRVVRRGTATAEPAFAHSVHVEVAGLAPARPYWYRFRAAGEASPAGRTRTAPAADAAPPRLAFALASCQDYEHGWYSAHRHMAAEALDAVLFLGDYIYEASWGRNLVRHHDGGVCTTLDEYRRRYALYKQDPDLRACHAAHPWIATWDDHEVANDYANDRPERIVEAPAFLARRAAAYQAYYEHMPLRAEQRPSGPSARLHRTLDYGRSARIVVLDDRQYRDHEVCPRPERGGGSNVVEDAGCPARLDPRRTMLGRAQEAWLEGELVGSRARWNVIAQQTLMAEVDRRAGPARGFWTDGWDGYPAARARLARFLADRRIANPVIVGGDVHATYAADIRTDFRDPSAPVAASEVGGTSITSQGTSPANARVYLAENPHLKFYDPTRHGYVRLSLGTDGAEAALRAVDDVTDPRSGIATRARFAIAAGRPGIERV